MSILYIDIPRVFFLKFCFTHRKEMNRKPTLDCTSQIKITGNEIHLLCYMDYEKMGIELDESETNFVRILLICLFQVKQSGPETM